ncbi:MAG TPA: efflux RND transporter periplasmic adaptor subunit [Terriglobia bacterium]|nr:efflux RND transporter periplasmic adaptor subunit [Terriglobia bacterium]
MFKSKNKRSVALLSSLIAGTLLFGCAGNQPQAAAPPTDVTVDVAPVLTSQIDLKVTADALLYPFAKADIAAKVNSPVKRFYVERGAPVRSGQLLAELENRDLANAVAESKAAADQAEAVYQTTARSGVTQEVQKAELDAKAAKTAMDAQQKVYDARQELLRQGAISQKDVNDSLVTLTQMRTQYETAIKHRDDLNNFAKDEEIKAAAAQRDVAKAHHVTTQTQLGYSRIFSPINGVVTDRPLFEGEMPQSGASLLTVMDVSQVIARAHLSPTDAALLKVGNAASLIFPGLAPAPGKVTQISPALDPTSTTVEVWIQAANPDRRLKPGSSLRVEAIAQSVPSALVIPYSAVVTNTATGSTSVVVVDAQNKPSKKVVALGIRDQGNVQVINGLSSGERVVTTGAFQLAQLDPAIFDQTKVTITPSQ